MPASVKFWTHLRNMCRWSAPWIVQAKFSRVTTFQFTAHARVNNVIAVHTCTYIFRQKRLQMCAVAVGIHIGRKLALDFVLWVSLLFGWFSLLDRCWGGGRLAVQSDAFHKLTAFCLIYCFSLYCMHLFLNFNFLSFSTSKSPQVDHIQLMVFQSGTKWWNDQGPVILKPECMYKIFYMALSYDLSGCAKDAMCVVC